MAQISEGAKRITAERERQISVEGWSAEHDDKHADGSLGMAAACYAAPKRLFQQNLFAAGQSYTDPWPWDDGDRRPHRGNVPAPEKATIEQRIRLLEKAGALCAAEIDRLLRLRDSLENTDGCSSD